CGREPAQIVLRALHLPHHEAIRLSGEASSQEATPRQSRRQLCSALEVAVDLAGADDRSAAVDRMPVLHNAIAADAVELLEAEPNAVDSRMAARAHRIGRVLIETLARR